VDGGEQVASHVDPDQIPYVNAIDGAGPVDEGAIRDSANSIRVLAGQIRTGGQDTVSAWAPISAVYHGPGDQDVWAGMTPIGPATDQLATDLETVAGAVSNFADDIAPIVLALANLRVQAQDLVYRIDHFVPYVRHDWDPTSWKAYLPGALQAAQTGTWIKTWDEDPDLVSRNNQLVKDIGTQVSRYVDAERACAKKIDGLYGGTVWSQYGADGGSGSVYGYNADTLGQMDAPWGGQVAQQESCEGKTVNFVPSFFGHVFTSAGGFGDFVLNLTGANIGEGPLAPGEHGFHLGSVGALPDPECRS